MIVNRKGSKWPRGRRGKAELIDLIRQLNEHRGFRPPTPSPRIMVKSDSVSRTYRGLMSGLADLCFKLLNMKDSSQNCFSHSSSETTETSNCNCTLIPLWKLHLPNSQSTSCSVWPCLDTWKLAWLRMSFAICRWTSTPSSCQAWWKSMALKDTALLVSLCASYHLIKSHDPKLPTLIYDMAYGLNPDFFGRHTTLEQLEPYFQNYLIRAMLNFRITTSWFASSFPV